MFALGCAVARAFPLYTRKNFHSVKKQSTITVEFCLKGKNNDPPTDAEITCLAAAADGIRLSAQIVDTPCNEMHTDAFVQVTCSSWGFYQRMCRY
jgi:probable aminopeptidase NPEPL1